MLGREYGAPNVYYFLNARYPTPKPASSVHLEGDRFKLAYLGDQSGWNRKNLGELFAAVSGEDCDLFMIGRVYEPTKMKAPENVRFVGRVPPDEVHAILTEADCLVNGTDQDADLKAAEYIFTGKPLLLLRRRGMQENVFTHLHDAYITDNLKEGLNRLMNDATLRERLAANIRSLPVLDFDERADRMLDIIQATTDEWRARNGHQQAAGAEG